MQSSDQLEVGFQKNNIFIWSFFNLFFFAVCWVLAGLIINLFFSEIMPSAFLYNDLSDDAIESGEGIVLIKYYIFGIFLAISILIHFGLSIIVCHHLIETNKKVIAESSYTGKRLLFSKIFFWIMTILYLVLPIVFYFYFLKKEYFGQLKTNNELQTNLNQKKHFWFASWLVSIFLVLIANMSFIGVPAMVPLLLQTKPYYNAENVVKFYKFSNNHDNVLYLYFDRTDSWRVKNIVENNQELRNQFKDFTFYANNLSLSDTTISSIPSMTFGYNADVINKELETRPIEEVKVKSLDNDDLIIFPGSNNVKTKELTIQQYYKYALANFVAFWNYLGYKITNFCQFPFYGWQNPLIFQANNAWQINDDLRNEFNFKGFTGVNSSELQRYHDRSIYWNNTDDAETLQNLPNNLQFTNTDSKLFCGLYSQQTHWNVTTKNPITDEYSILYGNTPKNIELGLMDALKDTATLIKKLKTEPFYENDGNISNVYKHTTIIIISDHGQCFDEEPYDNPTINPNSTEKAGGYDAVFMIKPVGNKQPELNYPFSINYDLITNADHLALIRHILFPNNPKWVNSSFLSPDPLNPKYRYEQNNTIPLINDFHNLYHDFSNNENNILWKRTSINPLRVMHPIDWRYIWWRKRIKASKIRQFKYVENNEETPSIFNQSYWTDINSDFFQKEAN